MGRQWASPAGNLYASLLLTMTPAPDSFPLSLLAGIALFDAVSPHLASDLSPADLSSSGPLFLKWPNDLIDRHGRKLGGILVEQGRVQAGGKNIVVLGFGVNVAHAPRGLERPAVCLAEMGHKVSVKFLFAELSRQMQHWLSLWQAAASSPRSQAFLREAWSRRAMPVGQDIAVHDLSGRLQTGRFGGLTDEGSLRLLLPDGGERCISMGDITLL